jgi:hypothetical protein
VGESGWGLRTIVEIFMLNFVSDSEGTYLKHGRKSHLSSIERRMSDKKKSKNKESRTLTAH